MYSMFYVTQALPILLFKRSEVLKYISMKRLLCSKQKCLLSSFLFVL